MLLVLYSVAFYKKLFDAANSEEFVCSGLQQIFVQDTMEPKNRL
jgi:hypothetical protein